MLKINTQFEKEKFLIGGEETLLLVELNGMAKKKTKKLKRIPLNISIAIDISASMSKPVKGYDFNQHDIHEILAFQRRGDYVSKMDQAKLAASKLIEGMQDEDLISIVLFDHEVSTLVPATKINQESKREIINKIQTITYAGGTNIHEGWLTSVKEVTKNLSSKHINRVLLLTDGEVNSGVTDHQVIASHAQKMAQKSISTTCFGIGKGFNEDLLLEMSTLGGGNFYYIENDDSFDSMIQEELSGLKNLSASDVKVKLLFDNGVTVHEQMNQLNMQDGFYITSDLRANKTNNLLFKLKLPKDLKEFKTEVIVKYKDSENNEKEEKLTVSIAGEKKKKWEKLAYNSEVQIQETLLVVAKDKMLASQAIASGDTSKAKQILDDSKRLAEQLFHSTSDPRMQKELNDLNSVASLSDDMNATRKAITSQSYLMRYSR